VLLSIFVVSSWWGGTDGTVVLTFNHYHERLVETILFPVSTLGGIAGFVLMTRYARKIVTGGETADKSSTSTVVSKT
jgi:hypothetical protein